MLRRVLQVNDRGAFHPTPHQVVRLIVELLDPKPGMRISDPTCGSGGMLVQVAEHVAKLEGNLQIQRTANPCSTDLLRASIFSPGIHHPQAGAL